MPYAQNASSGCEERRAFFFCLVSEKTRYFTLRTYLDLKRRKRIIRLCGNHSHHHFVELRGYPPLSFRRTRRVLRGIPRGQASSTPVFDHFFYGCPFTAILHGARVDRPRAPVAPSLPNTISRRFSHENHAGRYMMGADAPIPPLRQVPPPPRGLSRRLQFPVFPETELAPPCRTGALRRGALISILRNSPIFIVWV